jgi:hypothetical protein
MRRGKLGFIGRISQANSTQAPRVLFSSIPPPRLFFLLLLLRLALFSPKRPSES